MKTPLIAIVGRPNVGKSTLFNRLIGQRYAVVADEAGTTRDRISHHFEIQEYNTLLIDTGGLQIGNLENIEADVQAQAHTAIEEADIILFVTDASNELTTDDFAAADILRKSQKPVIFIANKCDNPKVFEEGVYNLYELGFGEPVRLSAIHKTGVSDLEHRIVKELKTQKFKPGAHKPTKGLQQICILGKPNAGKSSLVNALIGENKIIVSEIAGTTRDATDTEITYEDKKYNLIDTAGLRRRGKIERGIEKFSALRCIRGIERSEVVVLLMDGNAGITAQDCHIAQYALEEHKGLILAINKIDLLESGEEIRNAIIAKLRRRFAFVPWAKVIFISAKDGKNIFQTLTLSDEIIAERRKRIPTPELNSFLQRIVHKHLPTSPQQKKPKFMYASQVDINPPKFTFFFRNPKSLHFSYPRYLENEIRKQYGFEGTSLQLNFKNTNKEEGTESKEKKEKRRK